MRRPGLTLRLFLVLLALGASLVLAMALATQYSVHSGLSDYITEVELARLTPLVRALEGLHRKEGSWDSLARERGRWHALLRESLMHAPPEWGEPPPEQPGGPGFDGPPPGVWGPGDGRPPGPPFRLRLLDAGQRSLIGPPPLPGEALHLLVLKQDERIVGWLALSPPRTNRGGLEGRFLERQMRMLAGIAVAALALALAAALLLGRNLGAPVLHLAGIVRSLSLGDYRGRARLHGQDELGRLGSDINTLAETLERNEGLRREAMADVSHELRTPVALLRAKIEAMQDGLLPRDDGQLGELADAVQRLSRLVDDLYDMALADAGVLHYAREPVDFTALVTAALTAAEPGLAQAGLRSEATLEWEVRVLGDARRLRQVLDNLLENCRRYTDAGGRVRLTLARVGGSAQLRVEDTAPGVPEAIQPQLFQRFFRVEASRSRASGGAGLGLAIARTIVQAHGGRIEAGPSALGGLAITLQLPEAAP